MVGFRLSDFGNHKDTESQGESHMQDEAQQKRAEEDAQKLCH